MKAFVALLFFSLLPSAMAASCPTPDQIRSIFNEAYKNRNLPIMDEKADNGFNLRAAFALRKNVFRLQGYYDVKSQNGGNLNGTMKLETDDLENETLSAMDVVNSINRTFADKASKIALDSSHTDCIYKVTAPFHGSIGNKHFELTLSARE